jgi:hypothetical protein
MWLCSPCEPHSLIWRPHFSQLKGILSTKIVICPYPKLLSFSILTFIKWRLTPSYAAKDTIFWQKRPKTIVIRIVSTSLSSFQRTNWSPTYLLHLFHLEDTSLLFIFLSEFVKVCFLPHVDSFSFAQEPHVVYCF